MTFCKHKVQFCEMKSVKMAWESEKKRREAKNKETKIRTANALQALNAIGIGEDKAGLILRTLLKLYNNNWRLIEEENYRVLADAVFERDENEVEEQTRKNVDNKAQDHLEKEAQENHDLERPPKMLKRKYLNGQPSSHMSNTSRPPTPPVRPKEEPAELPETQSIKLNGRRGKKESLPKNAERTMMAPPVVMSQSPGQSKGKQPSSSNSLVHENGDRSHPDGINRSQQSVRQTNAPRLPAHRMRLRERPASLQTPPKAQDHLEKEAQENQDLERPSKMLKREYLKGQPSQNTSITSMPPTPPVRPKEKPAELSETQSIKRNGRRGKEELHPKKAERTMMVPPVVMSQSPGQSKGKQPSSSNSLVHENDDHSHPSGINKSQQSVQQTNPPRLPAHRMRLRERPASLQTPPKVKRPAPKTSSHALQLKEYKVEPDTVLSPEKNKNGSHALFKPNDEPITGKLPFSKSKVLADMFSIDTSHGGDSTNGNSMLIEDCTPEPTTLKSVRDRNAADVTVIMYKSRNNGELETSRGECSSTLAIASSQSGEVKLSLSYKLAPGRPDFHKPKPEALLKYVEDKCLRSPNDTCISMMGLMEEMCECFLEFGTDLNRKSVIVDATKSSATGIRGAKASGIGSLNEWLDSRSGDKVPQPKAKVLSPPSNGRNGGGPQLNKLDAEDRFVINRVNQGNCAEEMDGLSMAAVQQPQLSSQIIKPINDVIDIAKGQEKFAITLVNEVNDERPPSFCYIRQNAIYQNAYANFSLARIAGNSCCSSCSGDCLSLSIPCACSYESGGEFAYTADGLVKEELLEECISMNRDPKKHCQFFCKECPLERSKCEDIIEPCKGHLVRSFVKECWIKCGCNIQCGNRVVQRGISRRLQVFMTPEGKGWGLRTLEDLPKGAFVCEYVGEVLTNAELFERVLRSPEGEKHSYPVLLDADWCAEGVLKDEEALCLDATYYGNVARFINHKCYDSNLVEIPVEVETPDHHYYHLAFFTSRKVKAMEELTWDYGIDFDDHEHPIKAFRCQCGSKFCRNIKRTRSRAGRR